MPYHRDKDYKESFIFSIKNILNNILIDITFFDTYGTVEVETEKTNISLLESLPLVDKVYEIADRGMIVPYEGVYV